MMLIKLRFLVFLLAAVTASSVGLSFSWAAGTWGRGEGLYDTPVYYEKTDRFFELVHLETSYPGRFGRDATGWRQVTRLAEGRFHDGRRGRLAVIDSAELNVFLRDTFKPAESGAWIGLKYYCRLGLAIWVNGKRLDQTAYQNWNSPWNVDGGDPHGGGRGADCGSFDFLPVHYWPYQGGFKWNANGPAKHMRTFFVEYPPADEYWD